MNAPRRPRHRTSSRLAWGLLLLPLLAAPSVAESPEPTRVERYHRHRCGRVVAELQPPTVHVRGDVDGDGKGEYFIANGAVIEAHRVIDPGPPPITERLGSPLYVSRSASPYACSDLLLHDVDADGDLDLVYATPTKLVVLETSAGAYRNIERMRYDRFAAEADVRVVAKDLDGEPPIDLVVHDVRTSVSVEMRRAHRPR